jgi:16S rRNA (adenine1518-N6/adenine1519-N6)-dimethyltransferase
MCDVLRKEFGHHPGLTLYEADAAEFDYSACLAGGPGVVAGNLPYQITGRIMRRIVECEADIIAAIFMVQEEVAQRLCASTADKARGALSVMVQARCEPAVLLRLPPTAFHPRPSVRSAVIRLIPRQQKLLPPGGGPIFDATVKAAFVTRRKTVRNSMLAAGFADAAIIDEILAGAQVDPGMRAEKIEVAQFLRMAQLAAELRR